MGRGVSWGVNKLAFSSCLLLLPALASADVISPQFDLVSLPIILAANFVINFLLIKGLLYVFRNDVVREGLGLISVAIVTALGGGCRRACLDCFHVFQQH